MTTSQKNVSAYHFVTSLVIGGIKDGQLLDPYGIAVDSSDNVYLVDPDNSILKFDSNGNFITRWGSNGTGSGEFDFAYGIGIDSQDNVYLADSGNHRVVKFSPAS